jgi:hypothetical protein
MNKVKFKLTSNLFAIIVLILLTYFDFDIINSRAQDDFRIRNTNMFMDTIGHIHIIGELENISDEPKRNVGIYANFIDADGTRVANASAGTAVRSLNQGYTSPFELLLLDNALAKKVASYLLEFKGDDGLTKSYSLELISAEDYREIYGFYHINGKVLNQGNETATNTLVISSFYDHNGTIMHVAKALTEPGNITEGNEASFSLVMDNRDWSHKVRNFTLTIDSDQYVSLQ